MNDFPGLFLGAVYFLVLLKFGAVDVLFFG
jgi:hypothetical protein